MQGQEGAVPVSDLKTQEPGLESSFKGQVWALSPGAQPTRWLQSSPPPHRKQGSLEGFLVGPGRSG